MAWPPGKVACCLDKMLFPGLYTTAEEKCQNKIWPRDQLTPSGRKAPKIVLLLARNKTVLHWARVVRRPTPDILY